MGFSENANKILPMGIVEPPLYEGSIAAINPLVLGHRECFDMIFIY
jgi:hypothetical protein